jgi:hypothetical protein
VKTLFYPLIFLLHLITFDVLAAPVFEHNTLEAPIGSFCGKVPENLMEDYRYTIDHLQKRELRHKQKLSFLKYLFYYVHRRHLKHYLPYSAMSNLLQTGAYDCVSGTAFYALILEEMGFRYQIWEMNYHVYLSVQSEHNRIVFEATDPIKGFITDPDQIDQHYKSYSEEARQYLKDSNTESLLIHQEITLIQLAGLQLYNQAIEALQNQIHMRAERYTKEALLYYRADRIEALLHLAKKETKALVFVKIESN